MISFVLDILKEVVVGITKSRITDNKGKAIRAFVVLHDAVKQVEASSEELLRDFRRYVESEGQAFDKEQLRERVRTFSAAACSFAAAFRRVELPLEVFGADVRAAFVAIAANKLFIARSLLELAAPQICLDKALPWTQRDYVLRVLDYAKFGFAVRAVQKEWDALIRQRSLSDLAPANFDSLKSLIESSGHEWVSEGAMSAKGKYEDLLLQASSDFKVIAFDDFAELRRQVADGESRVRLLRIARESLATFLGENFTVADFF
jgi:hypothetical protein